MLWSERGPGRGIVFAAACMALALSPWLSAQKVAATLACPATIDVSETATPLSGWQTAGVKVTRTFERASIYNGKSGSHEFELAPDDEKEVGRRFTQSWELRGYRTMNLFLRCRYSGTDVVLFQDIPEMFTSCRLAFVGSKKGNITGGSSFSCR